MKTSELRDGSMWNKASETDVLAIHWNGQDDVGGSGVAGYDIYVSTDNGPFELCLDATTDTEPLFIGEDGHTYAFYSVAVDNVGHVELPPVSPDAQTTVVVATATVAIAARLVRGVTTRDANGEADSLPDNEEWIDEWDTFRLEIWVDTPYLVDLGVTGAQLDLMLSDLET